MHQGGAARLRLEFSHNSLFISNHQPHKRIPDHHIIARIVVGGPHAGQLHSLHLFAKLHLFQCSAQVGGKLVDK